MLILSIDCDSRHRKKCTLFFFFNDTATTEIYTLSLHDALPISRTGSHFLYFESRFFSDDELRGCCGRKAEEKRGYSHKDRKSTRLNSSHLVISYAVFCLKKQILHHFQTPVYIYHPLTTA